MPCVVALQVSFTATWNMLTWKENQVLMWLYRSWASKQTSQSTCRSGRPGWPSVSTPHTHSNSTFLHYSHGGAPDSHDSLALPHFSDYPGHCGSHHHPAAHFPQEENPYCHCSHQRSQQVRIHIRAFSFVSDMDQISRTETLDSYYLSYFLVVVTHIVRMMAQTRMT